MKTRKLKGIVALLCCLLVVFTVFGLVSCGKSEKTTLTGHYYTEYVAEGETAKRGCELYVILNADESIYTIALDDESAYQCADQQVLWSIKSSGYFNNVAGLGIEGINKLHVVCDENGLPTTIEGMDTSWLVPMNTAGCGMVILALQNAFESL